MFAIKAVVFLAILACILYLMGLAEVSLAWIMGFSFVFCLTVFIAHITPMLTQHEINSNGIILRHGMIFNDSFAFSHIKSVEVHVSSGGFFGPASKRDNIVLASGSRGLVTVLLNHKKRFGMLLLRRANEIIIDLERPDEFVKLANEYIQKEITMQDTNDIFKNQGTGSH